MISKEKQKYLESDPKLFKNLVEKAFTGSVSPRRAIKAKCLDCVGYEQPFEEIANCTSQSCAPVPYRPYQEKGKDASNV